ncbi:Four and a half LIM domains protein 1 [Collichthys lucidus]|uniref:Four and a half LIM domains protein 1 n=1 Tax=Collichthys lucidus TaxID=240159 RepID=A0A4U5V6E6_COLLU|nr:Four and a half LIM domains protein 1 [Collichthys lucidus]
MADTSHCFYCQEDLGGKRFVRNQGKPVCIRCHTKFCANTCTECHRPIPVESKELSHKGKYWHEECFRCAKCYKPLAKEPFSTKDDRIMCGKCCSREDAPRCNGCYKAILAGTESVEYKGNSWHDECFTCYNCKRPIGSQSFLSKGSDVYCSPCYDKKFAKHCVSCKKLLLKASGKDEFYQPPGPGFGKGVNVVNYEGSSWHEYCFNCKKCSLSLANKSFVTKGRDILCADCGNK